MRRPSAFAESTAPEESTSRKPKQAGIHPFSSGEPALDEVSGGCAVSDRRESAKGIALVDGVVGECVRKRLEL